MGKKPLETFDWIKAVVTKCSRFKRDPPDEACGIGKRLERGMNVVKGREKLVKCMTTTVLCLIVLAARCLLLPYYKNHRIICTNIVYNDVLLDPFG